MFFFMNVRSVSSMLLTVFAIYLFLQVFFMTTSFSQETNLIKIAAPPYPPYCNCDGTGLIERILLEAYKSQGYDTEITCYPLKRAIHYLETDEVKIMMGEEELFPDFDIQFQAVLCAKLAVIYIKDKYPGLDFARLKVLKGKRITMCLGSSQADLFRSFGYKVEETPGFENNIRKIVTGRVDFVSTFDSSLPLLEKIHPNDYDKFGMILYGKICGGLIVKKNSSETKFLEILKDGLEVITKNETYEKIIGPFYNKKVPEWCNPIEAN